MKMNIINSFSQKITRQMLRNNMPKPEQVLWYFLRKRQIGGLKFRRQVSIGKYIVDFCSFEKKLIIEIDGDSHFSSDSVEKYDKKRTNFFKENGFSLLRFSNIEIMKNREECVNRILEFLGKDFVTPLSSPLKGEKLKGFGFTLIELVVTMSLVGILFVISAPMFTEFKASSSLNSSSQLLETTFGEAFSGARSRPEEFTIKSSDDLTGFSLNSRDFQLNSGVTFTDSFEVIFKPPFGDIEIDSETDASEIIEVCNSACVWFQVNKKSGLVERVGNPNANQDQDE